ncbi:hypothetical protein LSG31_16680 [Fodinisporobacter ferrooxydans]|uniref:Pyridine nucleotide-disulphide oxidoreductase dimerisation domain-containing protein n=1 Tax=Fodinisporobacter ferrooxydans TaxID=2901836 RepID=A0ABY4CJ92_9BACL|nr:hypothetical protein LSG31_16680 [Alicyclobacillaceae bacterium MYW30-H2]
MTDKILIVVRAKDRHGQVHVYTAPFHDVDRTVIDCQAEGFVKVIADK